MKEINIVDNTEPVLFKSKNKISHKLQNDTKYYQTNYWMFNNQVFQYSVHLFVKNEEPFQIDSIIMMNEEVENIKVQNHYSCMLKSIKTGEELYFNMTTILSFKLSNSKRVKCNIKGKLKINLDDIVVAIINKLDFNDKSENVNDIESGKMFFQLPHNMINFQKPRIIHMPQSKIPKIAHCLHYTYNYLEIGIDKILKWLEYQKSVGIDKIILYNSDRHNILENAVYSKYNLSFIEIRPYYINYDIICDFYRLNLLKEENIIKYQVLKDYCEELFYTRFDDPSYNSTNRWKHQKVSCNDCYTSFEHVYEFVAYYDFDEIIYPRKASMNAYLSLGNNEEMCYQSNFCLLSSNFETSFDLYNYTKDILKRTYHSKDPLGSVYFTNAFYLEENYYVKKLIDDLGNIITNKRNFFESKDKTENISIHLKFTRNLGHTFFIKSDDYDHLKQIYDSYMLMACIYDRFNSKLNNKLDLTFKRFLYFITEKDHQLGKLIHYTDNIYAIHTHFSLFKKDFSQKFYVDINDGILTHFRSDMFKKAQERKSSILNLKIDLEYYVHIVSKYSNTCSVK